MPLETGTYISDLVVTNPPGTDAKSGMDDHLRLIKSTIKNTFPNVTGAVTKTQAELNSVTDRGFIAGQTWTGTHQFPATTYGVTAAFGASGTGYATLDYVNAVVTNAALPGQGGNSGKFLTTNGTTASWATVNFQTTATAADIKTGTDTTKVVTAANLLSAMGFTAYVQTADQTITSAGALTIAHGLGRTPVMFYAFLKNVTAEFNYSIGDIVPVSPFAIAALYGVSITADATNIYVRFSSNAQCFVVIDKTSGVVQIATNVKWSFFMRALA